MVHIPSNKIHSLDPESRAAEVGLLDAEIGMLKADNQLLAHGQQDSGTGEERPENRNRETAVGT
jgi:hypothetical protein